MFYFRSYDEAAQQGVLWHPYCVNPPVASRSLWICEPPHLEVLSTGEVDKIYLYATNEIVQGTNTVNPSLRCNIARGEPFSTSGAGQRFRGPRGNLRGGYTLKFPESRGFRFEKSSSDSYGSPDTLISLSWHRYTSDSSGEDTPFCIHYSEATYENQNIRVAQSLSRWVIYVGGLWYYGPYAATPHSPQGGVNTGIPDAFDLFPQLMVTFWNDIQGIPILTYRLNGGPTTGWDTALNAPIQYSNPAQTKMYLGGIGNFGSKSMLGGNIAFAYRIKGTPQAGSFDLLYIEKIEGWAAWKWGIEWVLPATHRYKNSPPLIGG